MVDVRLYIGEDEIDLFDNIQFSADYSIADIKNPFSGNSSITKTFVIPATGRNKIIFGFVEDISAVGGLDQTVRNNARLEIDGTTVIEGVFKITSAVANKRGQITRYKGLILGGNGDWLSQINELSLQDLDYSDYDHIYNVANIDDSEAIDSSGSSILRDEFIVYPLANYGDFLSNDLPTQTNTNPLNIVRVEDRMPAFNIRNMFIKIFNDQGFKVTSDFLDSTFFRRLYLPFTGKLPVISEAEILSRSFRASQGALTDTLTATYSHIQTSFTQEGIKVDIDNDSTDGNFDNSGIFDTGLNEFQPTETGIYNLFGSLDYEATFSAKTTVLNALSEPPTPTSSYTHQSVDITSVNLILSLVKVDPQGASTILATATQRFDFVGDYGAIIIPDTFFKGTTISNKNLYVDATNISLEAGDIVYLSLQQKGKMIFVDEDIDENTHPFVDNTTVFPPTAGTVFEGDGFWVAGASFSFYSTTLNAYDRIYALKDDPAVEADWFIVRRTQASVQENGMPVDLTITIHNDPADDTKTTQFWNAPVGASLKKGDDMVIANLLPDIKQPDFLKSIKHLFNLYFYTDQKTREVYIEPFDDFVNNNLVDWTEKLDHSKDIEIRFLGDTLSRKLEYKYKNDTKDKYVEAINERRGKELASYTVDINNLFANIGTLSIENNIYAPTLMGYAPQINLNNNLIPKLWSENETTPPEWSWEYEYRIWYYDDFQQLKGGDKWNWEGTIRTFYPRFYTIEEAEDNDNLLYFDDTSISNGLFEKYYRNYQKTINESRLLKAYFNLDASDVAELDFRRPIQLTIDGEVNVYRLNRVINYDATKPRTTEVELLKIVAQVPKATVTTIADGGIILPPIDQGSGEQEEAVGIVATINGVTTPVLVQDNQGNFVQTFKQDTNIFTLGG